MAIIFIILLCIITVLTIVIFISKSMSLANIGIKHNKSSNSIRFTIFIIIILIIFIIFFPLILKTVNFEHYDNSNTDNQSKTKNPYQYGISETEASGAITFKTPFQTPPLIITQIIGNNNTVDNLYSVQVFNVSNTGFNYTKNMVSNSKSEQFKVAQLNPSTKEKFNWIAFEASV